MRKAYYYYYLSIIFFLLTGSSYSQEKIIFDIDLTKGSAGPGIVTGGEWNNGWRVTADDQRIVYNAGYPIVNGSLEVSFTMNQAPELAPNEGKINWVGLFQDSTIDQNNTNGDIFYARAGKPSYLFSKIKAYGKKFNTGELEDALGLLEDWKKDDKTVMKIKFEWINGRAIFYDVNEKKYICPDDKCTPELPIDKLQYVFLGSTTHAYNMGLKGIRFLSIKLIDLGQPVPSVNKK